MKRSQQEVVELLVFGLIALLIATGVLWVVGWLLGLIGAVFVWLAGVIWSLLRFIIPVAVLAAAVYVLVVLARKQGRGETAGTDTKPDVVRVEKASRPAPEVGKGTIDAQATTVTRGGAAVYEAPSELLRSGPERTEAVATDAAATDELRMDSAPSSHVPSAAAVTPAPEADTAPVEPLGEPETREHRTLPVDGEEQAMPVAETTHADEDVAQNTDEDRTKLRNELSEEQKAELREDDTRRPD